MWVCKADSRTGCNCEGHPKDQDEASPGFWVGLWVCSKFEFVCVSCKSGLGFEMNPPGSAGFLCMRDVRKLCVCEANQGVSVGEAVKCLSVNISKTSELHESVWSKAVARAGSVRLCVRVRARQVWFVIVMGTDAASAREATLGLGVREEVRPPRGPASEPSAPLLRAPAPRASWLCGSLAR